ncbi:hypothetical protein D3C75_1235140 [compost metagenome]
MQSGAGEAGELQVGGGEVGVGELRALGEHPPALDRHQRGAGEIRQARIALLQARAGQIGTL